MIKRQIDRRQLELIFVKGRERWKRLHHSENSFHVPFSNVKRYEIDWDGVQSRFGKDSPMQRTPIHGTKGEESIDEIQFERRNSKIVVRPTAATLRRTSKWNYATLHAGTLGHKAQRLVCRGYGTTIRLKGSKPLIVSRLTSIKRYLMNKTFVSSRDQPQSKRTGKIPPVKSLLISRENCEIPFRFPILRVLYIYIKFTCDRAISTIVYFVTFLKI